MGNFTRAAEELNVTQGAVSKQVVKLEAFLGTPLFVREAKALHLTRAGQIYAERVHDILSECAEVTAEVMRSPSPRSVTIASASGTAALFLASRIAKFTHEHPEISIRVIVREAVFNLNPTEFDIGIYYVRDARPPNMDGVPFFSENVRAYCAPSVLGGLQVEPQELMGHVLLVADQQQRQWMGWRDWFRLTCGEIGFTPKHTLTATSYPLLAQLAIAGAGIILGWDHMIDALVESGQLVPASEARATYGGGYQIIWPSDRRDTSAVSTLRDWLIKNK